ncbi:MAG: HAMP domain-containing histidine kinase [Spirochaetia bacterium]|nr:HAMP domain-containing histidine kinase [Spirochaetia bacterium]
MKKKPSVLLYILALVVMVATIGLLWVVIIRESERRDLMLEYEAFKASSVVIDEYRRDSSFSPKNDTRIEGVGFYGIDGTAIQRYGTAPSAIAIPASIKLPSSGELGAAPVSNLVSVISADRKSIELFRYLGPQAPGRGMGMGMGMGRGRQSFLVNPPAMPYAPSTVPPDTAAPNLLSNLNTPLYVWMEYSAESYFRARNALYFTALLISAVLLILFGFLTILFQHNESLKEKEMANRELVQLGEAARTLAHEIKNPLGIMRIQTARIRRAAGEKEDASSQDNQKNEAVILASAANIDQEILRLSSLTDRIREFLKADSADLHDIDLIAVLRTVQERYRHLEEEGIAFALELPDIAEATVQADQGRLLSVLDNLITNAKEACSTSSAENKRITIRLYLQGKYWCVAVMDNGPGIPKDLEARLFTPFFTTKEKGSGIGLALAKKIMQSFKGELLYEGNQESGAVFVLKFPAVLKR